MSDIISILEKSIYIHENNEYGHLVIILKDLIRIKTSRLNVEIFIDKVVKEVEKSLEISGKHGNRKGYVHIYFNDCSISNFPLSLFKKLNKVLTSNFEDTVKEIFIYSNSNTVSKLWNIIKFIVDSDTRDKIKIIKEQ